MRRENVSKRIKRERSLMLRGKGAALEARKQLEGEEAEHFYDKQKPKRKRPKYVRTTDEETNRWADSTANMIYNRKKKRGKL